MFAGNAHLGASYVLLGRSYAVGELDSSRSVIEITVPTWDDADGRWGCPLILLLRRFRTTVD